ncbi:Protein S100-A11 [Sciurus carolinensis]|uniref:Protein S100-A11 n=2 Tax=Sciurus TaxID=10001 RepID=A0AA41MR09_SCICA|nr:Protein S100-A11 [Sciurus carolinensis]
MRRRRRRRRKRRRNRHRGTLRARLSLRGIAEAGSGEHIPSAKDLTQRGVWPPRFPAARPLLLLRVERMAEISLFDLVGHPSPLRRHGPPGQKMSHPTETERCIESLIAVFQKYAGKDGNSCTLSKREFLSFMNTELAAFTKNQKDPGVLDRMMKKLDLNSDGQLDFQEFLNLIGGLAVACHESFLKSPHYQKRI